MNIIIIAFNLLFKILSGSNLYISFDVIIIECVPLDANRNADIKKTAILKLNPCPPNMSVKTSAISFGIDEDIVNFTASIGIFKLFVITPTKAIVGIIDITRKKAS